MSSKIIKVAILDLYNNFPNQGLRSIKAILDRENGKHYGVQIQYQFFEVRYKNQFPDINEFDVFISSGGPGDPFDGVGTLWEANYFKLLDMIWANNQNVLNPKKFIFSICHSFQMACRFFNLATVSKRKSTSFGVFPCHMTEDGRKDPLFSKLKDPFYIVDSRDWQCLQPNMNVIKQLGASILSLEKIRPHVSYERALMALRISPYWVATQFHPEADPFGMIHYFKQEEKKNDIIKNHGQEKYDDMLFHLEDKDKIYHTNQSILPAFLADAIQVLRPEFQLA